MTRGRGHALALLVAALATAPAPRGTPAAAGLFRAAPETPPGAGPARATTGKPPGVRASPATETPPGTGTIERLDPRLDALVAPGARLETVARGFTWIEGPVWHPGGYLLFSDVARNTVFRWREGAGADPLLHPSGYAGPAPFPGREPGSNGLALDAEGRLVLCEHGERRVSRLEPDGRRTVLADRYRGKRLNSPNDAVLDSRGNLYFTDPPFGLPGTFDDPARELEWSGVYRLTPAGELTLLTAELRAPNGIALAPSGRTLYVSQSDPGHPLWMVYELRDDGTLAPGRVLHDGATLARRWPGLPDGMAVDAAGNLFAAGPGGVHVLAPDGTRLGSVLTGAATSNCAFGGDGSDLYVTAGTTLYRLRVRTRGLGVGERQSNRGRMAGRTRVAVLSP